MLNWPRVTCSSSSSMFAPCSNKRLVTRATTPVLSRPMTVIVASCRTGKEEQKRVGGKRGKRPGGLAALAGFVRGRGRQCGCAPPGFCRPAQAIGAVVHEGVLATAVNYFDPGRNFSYFGLFCKTET